MKCKRCGSKKGKRACKLYNDEFICSNCCGTIRNIEICNSKCNFMKKEEAELIPYSSIELTEVGRGKVILFSESLFLPNISKYLWIDVEYLTINIKSPILISIDMKFKIESRLKRKIEEDEVYYIDGWKRNKDNYLPLLQIYTIGLGNINNELLKISENEEKILIENNHLDTWIPNSKAVNEKVDISDLKVRKLPLDIKMAPCYYGNHFIGKNNTIFSKLKLNKEYKLSFDVEYKTITFNDTQIILPLGIFFPFEFVNFKKYKVNLINGCTFNRKSKIQMLLPFEEKEIMCFATPLENNNSLSAPKYTQMELIEQEDTFHYDRYAIFNHYFNIDIDKVISANIIFNKIPIFTGIYDTFNKVYKDEYSPVEVTIFNKSENIEKVKIEVEILDLSYKIIKDVYIDPNKVMNINIAPQLMQEKIEKLSSNVERNIYVKISWNDEILNEETHNFLVYPKEIFVGKLDNGRNDWKIDFRSFLARWITPSTNEIDRIISEASDDDGILGGTTDNLYRREHDIKKIYDVLNKMKYAIRTTTFSEGNYHVQRISLPKTTVNLKSGNCIDLSLLLASCYEAIKLKTYIILIPGHAFLGVELSEKNLIYIESTCLGKKEYSEAVQIGKCKFNEFFDVSGNPKDNNSIIIDVSLARKSGILPMN